MKNKIVRTDANQSEWEAGGCSELPWKVGRRDKTAVINASGTIVICDTYTKENAALIVRAVNSHYALVRAAKMSLAALPGDQCFDDERLALRMAIKMAKSIKRKAK